MTSLTETLPILDDAVPALPGKVEAVARKSEEFHREALAAVGLFHDRRQEAESLVEEVRQALDSARDHVGSERERVETSCRDLEEAASDGMRTLGERVDAVGDAGEGAAEAFHALEAGLRQAGDRTEGAQQDARAALDALTAEARSRGPELEAAGQAMSAAVAQAQAAIAEGQGQLAQAVGGLKETLLRLLTGAQARLAATYGRFDDVRHQQQQAVEEATTTLDAALHTIEEELRQRITSDVVGSLEPEHDAVEQALQAMGRQVAELEAGVEASGEKLGEQVAAVGERIGPLQEGVGQVKQAAEQVGIGW
jgi:hypothetical protein